MPPRMLSPHDEYTLVAAHLLFDSGVQRICVGYLRHKSISWKVSVVVGAVREPPLHEGVLLSCRRGAGRRTCRLEVVHHGVGALACELEASAMVSATSSRTASTSSLRSYLLFDEPVCVDVDRGRAHARPRALHLTGMTRAGCGPGPRSGLVPVVRASRSVGPSPARALLTASVVASNMAIRVLSVDEHAGHVVCQEARSICSPRRRNP